MSAASEQRHREAWPMLLNVGCGQTFHSEWINVDVVPASPAVRRVDLARGLPFPDRSIDACYCSHVLEHLRPDDAGRALAELFRVLRPGGVVRIVVPDLRRVAEQYLSAFAAVDRGGLQREADYDWMMMELLDQSVRDTTGGEMARFLRRTDLPNRDFIRSRIGEEAERFWREDDAAQSPGPVRRLRKAWKRLGARALLAYGLARFAGGAAAGAAFREGVYRQQGEVHRWMYDRFSLGRALRQAGFTQVAEVSANTSAIPGFAGYCLDTDAQGRVRKPDSLFMEGLRPAEGRP
jgi:predicted SAM-dependent methyltransferase